MEEKKQDIIKDRILKASTQYTEWLYSQDILDAKFNKRRLEAYNINIRKFYENTPNFHHIGLIEENKVLNSCIHDFISYNCKAIKLKLTVEGTAITYFKRWFLKKTLMNYDPKQIALTSLYLACKVEEVPIENIKAMAEAFKNSKLHFVHFNSENYGSVEKQLLQFLNFDLKVYTAFGPLSSLLLILKEIINDYQVYQEIEEECLKLARKSFFDHLIFKYTHGAIALSIFLYTLKKKSLFHFSKTIFENPYFPFSVPIENESTLLEIENELKIFEKIDTKSLQHEAKLVLQVAKDLLRKTKMMGNSLGFQKPMEKVSSLKRQTSQSNNNTVSNKNEEKINNEYSFFFYLLIFERNSIFEINEKPEKKLKIF